MARLHVDTGNPGLAQSQSTISHSPGVYLRSIHFVVQAFVIWLPFQKINELQCCCGDVHLCVPHLSGAMRDGRATCRLHTRYQQHNSLAQPDGWRKTEEVEKHWFATPLDPLRDDWFGMTSRMELSKNPLQLRPGPCSKILSSCFMYISS